MIPREILKKIRQIELRTNRRVTGSAARGCGPLSRLVQPKFFLCLALGLSGALSGCSSAAKPPQTIKVSVLGWVKVPGDYVLPKGSSIVAALEAARGFRDSDHSSSLFVGRTADGREKKFTVRIHNDAGKLKADFEVMDGDVIYAREVFF